MARGRCAVSNSPAWKAQLRRGERALRSPIWVGCQPDGALQERGSGGDASARPAAAGGSFQLAQLTASSGAGAAAARCHARRSGSTSRSVASASARCTLRR